MAAKVFGIDLGTTYSCISYVDESGRPVIVKNMEDGRTTPSVVWFESEENVVVGQVAKDNAPFEPDKAVAFVKKYMGKEGFAFEYNGRTLTPEEVSAYILKKVAEDAEKHLGEEVKHVVITHPAYFGLTEKEATKRAGEIAGLNVVSLIPEPVAAAYAYGCDSNENIGKTILVYDLGGGTFDVTMIHISEDKIGVICTGGDDNLGGFNWDQALIEHMAEVIAEQVGCSIDDIFDDPEMCMTLQNEAEKAKKTLSTVEKARVSLIFNGEKIRFEITLEQFDEMTSDLCMQTIVLTKQLLEKAKEKGYDHFDTLLLVGGSTYMKQIERAIVNEFGVQPQLFEPNEAVANGAALYANAKVQKLIEDVVDEENGKTTKKPLTPEVEKLKESITKEDIKGFVPGIASGFTPPIVNVTPKAYGNLAVDFTDNDIEKIFVLIPAQSQLPAEVSKKFGTVFANQSRVTFRIYETTVDGDIVEQEMGVEIGSVSMDLPAGLPKSAPLLVTFTIDDQGLLHMEGKDLTGGETCEVDIQISGGMSEEELAAARAAITSIAVS